MRSAFTANSARRLQAEVNMTPMIDVVFLLIIFFLVSSQLVRSEKSLALDLPTAATGDRENDPTPRVVVQVDAQGALSLGSEPIEPQELAAKLRVQNDSAGGTLRVRLRADQKALYAAVEPALAACAAAGIGDIALAVDAKERRP